ncbi:MAG TPA: dihydroorotase [Steroidobacteraceae bacterium]|nr:dihydroorotase [Steroidobacteraceae bacterium]
MSSPIPTLTIARPDDWHLHLRDGPELAAVLPATARVFARAVVMPNLKPPVTTVASASSYRDRIRAALPAGAEFEPLMTLYLTDTTPPAEIDRAVDSGFIIGVKCYPAGATTHSDAGVTSLARCSATIARMEERGLVLQLHGEATGDDVDPYDRESVFIDRELAPLLARHPRLRVVLEHVTTRAGVEFVRAAGARVGATITPQHLLLNRGAMFRGGLRPHLYCLPVLKRERDREALLAAATSDDARFFLGTDSAPHARGAKESACGCAGVYSAPVALPLYARAFEQAGRLDRLEAFASQRGADFYGLARNRGSVTLERKAWEVPARLPFATAEIVPMCAGESLEWQFAGAAVP